MQKQKISDRKPKGTDTVLLEGDLVNALTSNGVDERALHEANFVAVGSRSVSLSYRPQEPLEEAVSVLQTVFVAYC
jgi:hypothetical protein